MDVSEPLTQIADRRLVYKPNRSENPRPSGGGDGVYTTRRGPYVAPYRGDLNKGRHPSNSRGRGSKTRNRRPQHGGTRDQYHRDGYESLARNWYNNRSGYSRDDCPPSTPIHTYNHFTSFRDEGSRDMHRGPYPYMTREDEELSRSPYNYNQNYSGPSQYVDFHRPTGNHSRSPKPNEVPEGGGAYKGKRKRTH